MTVEPSLSSKEAPEDAVDLGDEDANLEEEKRPTIPLAQGIDIRRLIASSEGGGGVVFETEIDESLFKANDATEARGYFSAAADAANVEELIGGVDISVDEECDDDFQAIAAKMTDLTEDGGVKKKIVRSGLESYGRVPDRGIVTVHYSLHLEGLDEPFDSTRLRGRAEKGRLDKGMFIFGMEIAIKSMRKKEKADFLFEPKYAYGELGCPPRVPAKAQVLARLELLDFAEETAADYLLSFERDDRAKEAKFQKVEEVARKETEEGNVHAKREEWKAAVKRYSKAIRLLEDAELADEEEETVQKKHLNRAYLNAAQCYIKLQLPKKACIDLAKALEIDNKNAKTLFRMGKAKRMLDNQTDAMKYFERARLLKPHDVEIGREIAALSGQMARERKNAAELCRRMLGGSGEDTRETKREDNSPISQLSDETRQELYVQVEGYFNALERSGDPSRHPPMIVPPSFGAPEVAALQHFADQFGLKMEKIRQGRQWSIFKP